MDNIKTQCDAHSLISETMSRVQNNQGELYALLRKSSDEIGEANVRMATIEITQKIAFENITKQIEQNEKNNRENFDAIMSHLKHQSPARPKWTPKMITALLATIIGPSGLAAAIFILGGHAK